MPDYLIFDQLFTPSSRLHDQHLHPIRAKASQASAQLGGDNLDDLNRRFRSLKLRLELYPPRTATPLKFGLGLRLNFNSRIES